MVVLAIFAPEGEKVPVRTVERKPDPSHCATRDGGCEKFRLEILYRRRNVARSAQYDLLEGSLQPTASSRIVQFRMIER